MTEQIKDNILFRREVEIVITPQAQKVIATSKYTIEEFEKWAFEESKISLGGNNATLFLEQMFNKEVKENFSATS